MENLTQNNLQKGISYERVRLPKNFHPLKYNLDFYLDIKNISYELTSEMELEVINEKSDMIILNANLEKYKINSIHISKFDHISEIYSEDQTLKHFTQKEILELFSKEEIKD